MKTNINIAITKINWFYLFLLIIWVPLQIIFLKFDGAGRSIFLLSIGTTLLNFSCKTYRKIFVSPLSLLWLVWIVYSIVNSVFHNSYAVRDFANVFSFISGLLNPYLAMLSSAFVFSRYRKKSAMIVFFALCLYTLMGAFMMEGGLVYGSALNGAVNLGNELALNAIFIIFFAGILVKEHVVARFPMGMIILFVVALSFILAERKAIAALFIIILFFLATEIKHYFNIIFILSISIIIMLIANETLSDYLIVERFKNVSEEGAGAVYFSSNHFFSFLGDRLYYYYEGSILFLRHFVTGIGLENFMQYTGYNQRIHSEIMVQAAECGIIGLLLFVLFFFFLFKSVSINRYYDIKRIKDIKILSRGTLLAILFICIYSWIYDGIIYFIVFGVCLSFSYSREFLIARNNTYK